MKNVVALLFLLSLHAILMGCMGGSFGGDNPKGSLATNSIPISVTDSISDSGSDTTLSTDSTQALTVDSVQIRVWNKDQNPITEPKPLWDTTIASNKPFLFDPQKAMIDSASWNIEAVNSSNSRTALITNLSISKSGDLLRNDKTYNDTLQLSLQTTGNTYIYAPLIDTSSKTSIQAPPRDTLLFAISSSDSVYSSRQPSPKNNTVDSTQQNQDFVAGSSIMSIEDKPAYLVVLGTSVVLPFTGNSMPSIESMNLPLGTYVMATLDAQGNILSQWLVTVAP